MISRKLLDGLLDGTLEDHPNYVGGKYEGYYILIDHNLRTDNHRLQISAHSPQDPGNAALLQFVEGLQAETEGISSVVRSAYSIAAGITVDMGWELIDLLNNLIDKIIDYLKQNNYTSGCASCGRDVAVASYNINGKYGLNSWICPDCAEKIRNSLEESKAENPAPKKKAKLLPGLAGAFIGALIAGIAYVIIYRLGFPAAFVGLFIAFLTFKFYDNIGGCLDRKGTVICSLLVVAAAFLSNYIAWTFRALDSFKGYGWTFFEVFRRLSNIIIQADAGMDYVRELVYLFLFLLAGTAVSVLLINTPAKGDGMYTITKNK